MYLTDA